MNIRSDDTAAWDLVIEPKRRLFQLGLTSLWHYKYLIFLFAKRDFNTIYKQTILGPLWYAIQPLFTALVFSVIFGKVAKIPTDGIPPFLFYLSGLAVWGYFSDCIRVTSNTLTSNMNIFGKVYFPRLVVPVSVVMGSMVQFAIQFSLFLVFYFYFLFHGVDIKISVYAFLLPLFLIQMALLGLGIGILVSSLTTKYRDLGFATGFIMQLWMYFSPIFYPVSTIPEKLKAFYMLNPIACILELFRYAFIGKGVVDPLYITISWFLTFAILFTGLVLFNRVEKTFLDTI